MSAAMRKLAGLPADRGRRSLLILAGAAIALPVLAQSYPARPIRLLVGYPPGGGVDSVARLLAPRLSTALGQQVVVENRTGATGAIAADAVAKAPPDGYVLLLGETGLLINQYLQPHVPFDAIKSFAPVAGLFTLPLIIVANNDFPARTPAELIAALKKSPGKYSYATPGIGTVQHLGFEMLKTQAGVFVVHIPYRGAAQIVPDVVGGSVPLAVLTATAALAQAKAGKLKAIAVLSPAKLTGGEDIEPLSNALPGFSAAPRLSLLAPAGTPAAIVQALSDAVRRVLATPELIQAAAQQGAVPSYLAPGPLEADLKRESESWGKLIKDQKITAS
ncbi:MAG: transporter substrate-binding protein [Ramlibacter sp.]|nr:transporter substrate-binding protein [Ramlibacter sp.]